MGAVRDRLEEELGPRAVGTADVDGRSIPLAFAANEEQVVQLLRLAAAQGWSVLPIGSGAKLGRGPVHAKPRFALSVRGLSGITAYERGDGTVSARAGSTMAALAQVVRSGGNLLTPDVARPEASTLGGTLAAGVSGIDRLRNGPVRHHVLGMRVALADGTITKSGGRLVKNVTGYDLHRLYTGSRGSLCVILEASLRLLPAPESELVLRATYHVREAALAAAAQVAATGARPTCVCVTTTPGSASTLNVALSGRAATVAWERARIAEAVGACDVLEDDVARAAVAELRDRASGATLRAGVLPGSLARALAVIDERCAVLGTTADLVVHPGIASIEATLGRSGADAHAALAVAEALSSPGAEVELLDAPLQARAAFDALAHVGEPARAVMRRLKAAFDPAGRFAGGFGLADRDVTSASAG